MKNAMKKLMAFALVAVMLVGVLPFGAFAAEGDPITFKVKFDLDEVVSDPIVRVPSNNTSATIRDILEGWGKIDAEYYMSASVDAGEGWKTAESIDDEVMAGSSVTVRVNLASAPIEIIHPEDDPNYVPEDDNDDEEDNNNGIQDEENEDVYNPITFKVLLGDSNEVRFQKVAETKRDSAPISDLLTYWCYNVYPEWEEDYQFSHAYLTKAGEATGTTVYDDETLVALGDSITVRLKPIDTKNDDTVITDDDEIGLIIKVEGDGVVKQTKVKKDGVSVNYLLKNYWYSTWADDYDFVSYKLDDGTKGSAVADNIYAGEIVTVYLKEEVKTSKLNSNKVYLHVFMNNDFDDPAKNINITNGIAADGKLDLYSDVKSVIKEYFSAKDSDGIKYDGMYIAVGDWVGNFLTDTKDETITNVDELKEEGWVHLNVMVTNAKLKSSSTADSSNPKTGDNIMMAVSVMTLSASALAVFFYLNKKRAVK